MYGYASLLERMYIIRFINKENICPLLWEGEVKGPLDAPSVSPRHRRPGLPLCIRLQPFCKMQTCMQVTATTFLLPTYKRNLLKKLSWQGKLFCYRKQKSSLSGLNNYSSYNSTTSSANRNILLQGTEIKRRQVAFCLYYVVLLYFCFTTSCVLLTAKQKHTSGWNSYSNYAHSSLFFQNLYNAFSYFWCVNLFGGGRKTINCGEKTALKHQRILIGEKENIFILGSWPFLTCTMTFKRDC